MSHDAPMPQLDARRPIALAGFICGLVVLAASALAVLAGLNWAPGMTSGEAVLLAIATFPLAVVGTTLSVRGRTSTSRRNLARVGLLCCLVYFVLLVVGAVVLYLFWSACASQVNGCL